MTDDCNINNLAKYQVSAVFNSCAIRRSVSPKFIAARRAAKRSPIVITGKTRKGNPWRIFSWLSWLAVLLAGAYARRRRRRRSRATWRPNTKYMRLAALVYHVPLWYWISMLCAIDTCQFKVSADQYYVDISQAQVRSSSRSRVFWKLTADQELVFLLDRRLMSG